MVRWLADRAGACSTISTAAISTVTSSGGLIPLPSRCACSADGAGRFRLRREGAPRELAGRPGRPTVRPGVAAGALEEVRVLEGSGSGGAVGACGDSGCSTRATAVGDSSICAAGAGESSICAAGAGDSSICAGGVINSSVLAVRAGGASVRAGAGDD